MAAPTAGDRIRQSSRNSLRGLDKFQRPVSLEEDPFDDDTVERRRLKTKQKIGSTQKKTPDRTDSIRDQANSQRMVLHCRKDLDLDACWDDVSLLGQHLRRVHSLRGSHSLAVEGDMPTMKNLSRLGYELTEDSKRRTLSLEDSLEPLDRKLALDSQEIGYGVDMVRATEVWSRYEARGEGVKVCVMDTGVVAKHPDFEASHLVGWNDTADFVVPWYEDLAGHGKSLSWSCLEWDPFPTNLHPLSLLSR